MSEEKATPTTVTEGLVTFPEMVKGDPEMKQLYATNAAKKLIGEYEKDDAMKAVLDAGLRDRLTKKPDILLDKGRFEEAFENAKQNALKPQAPAQQTPPAPAQPPAQTPPPQGDPALQKTIQSSSLKEIQNVGHTSLSNAVDAKVLGNKEGVINMS